MSTELQEVRLAAQQRFEKMIASAYSKISEEVCIDRVQERIINQMDEVTNSLLGLDTRWSKLEIGDGILRKRLEPIIQKIINDHVAPKFEAEVLRLLTTPTIKNAINKAIKNRVTSAVYAIEHHNTDATRDFQKALETEISRLITEYTQPIG